MELFEIIKMLETDKTIKGRKEMLKGIARQARFGTHQYKAKEILEKKDQENGMKYSN